MAGKWLELLKEIAPQVTRVGIVREPIGQVGFAQWAVVGAAAGPLGVELSPINMHIAGDTEGAVSEFAPAPKDGLIVIVGTVATIQRELIIGLAARHKLPAVYPYRFFVEAGGLVSYGPNLIDLYRRTASYVDRILKGEKPGDLPIQAPTKYNLTINLKTAKALGLDLPPSLTRPRRRGDRVSAAARVHHAARRRGGGMAVRGARPRQGTYAPGRHLYEPTRRRPPIVSSFSRILTGTCPKGLDRWAQSTNRLPLGYRRPRSASQRCQ